MDFLCLLPALLPPLVSVLAWMNISDIFFIFPFSLSSVIIAHVFINTGLASVFFARLLTQYTSSLSAWAFLHKISTLKFLKVILFFELKKECLLIFLILFAFCFTSFSVPLLVGGIKTQTIEVFLANKLKDPALWPEAMALFFIETFFIFILFFLLYKIKKTETTLTKKSKKLFLLPQPFLLLFPVLPAILVIVGMLRFFSLKTFKDFFLIKEQIFLAGLKTLCLGIGTGFATLGLLCIIAWGIRDLFLRRFLIAYTGASTAFMGFAFLLLGGQGAVSLILKWIFGLSLLFLPSIYRLLGESSLSKLKNQVHLADLMQASFSQTFQKIIWPQCGSVFCFLAGIAGFWACGDFAYSALVLESGEGHLALLIQDLFSSHRFALATLVTWILIFLSSICFAIFGGMAFVLHKKFSFSARTF